MLSNNEIARYKADIWRNVYVACYGNILERHCKTEKVIDNNLPKTAVRMLLWF